MRRRRRIRRLNPALNDSTQWGYTIFAVYRRLPGPVTAPFR